MVGGGDPFYLKFWVKLTQLERNTNFYWIFALLLVLAVASMLMRMNYLMRMPAFASSHAAYIQLIKWMLVMDLCSFYTC